jgi:glutaredoxin
VKRSILKTVNHSGNPAMRAVGASIYGVVLLALLTCPLQAQTIYRVVGADGRITFSDKLPTSTDNATVLGAGGNTIALGATVWPMELRQAAGKYPVVLYTSAGCTPCKSGRELLGGRGIPFQEKTVNSAEDGEALQRISGASSLPLLTIGSQQIKGFSELEWNQFLDAAGYPKTSLLPANYRAPQATPLVAVQTAVPVVKPDESQVVRPATESSQPPANPTGIRF